VSFSIFSPLEKSFALVLEDRLDIVLDSDIHTIHKHLAMHDQRYMCPCLPLDSYPHLPFLQKLSHATARLSQRVKVCHKNPMLNRPTNLPNAPRPFLFV
jgi:hypothetical protein